MTILNNLYGSLDMATISEQLKSLRKKRNLTQARLAKLIEVSPRVYNRWENGDATPHVETLIKIADMLDVSMDELTGRCELSDKTVIKNYRLHELYKQVDNLTDEEQKAIIILLDGLVARAQMKHLIDRQSS